MENFFEPRISKETFLFVAVFAIFIVGVIFGMGIAENKFANAGQVNYASAYLEY